MKRRELLVAAGALAFAGMARPQGRVYRVAYVGFPPARAGRIPDNHTTRTFVEELRRLGYVEGRNLILEYRGVEGRFERVDRILKELVELKMDVIFAPGNRLARRAKALGLATPVVIAAFNPVEDGLVASLARPGGFLTGMCASNGPEVEAKRMQLLAEVLPLARNVAFLGEPFAWEERYSGAAARSSARRLGIDLWHASYSPEDISPALAQIERSRPDAVVAASSLSVYGYKERIGAFMREHRIPSSHPYDEAVKAGGLMSYGFDFDHFLRRIAKYVADILQGGEPATMPVEFPSKFRMAINLTAARELGIAIPDSVLLRADRVIG
jgi:ABC-type uncharacterized transport system substrate-binding protein